MLAIYKDHLHQKLFKIKYLCVNFPDRALAIKVDYCGLKSGKKLIIKYF